MKKLNTIKTEDFTIIFENHDKLIEFIENRDFEFETLFPYLKYYKTSEDNDLYMQIKYLTFKN
jgi:hypothetical protein